MIIKEAQVTHDGTIRVGDNVVLRDGSPEVYTVVKIEQRQTLNRCGNTECSDELIYTKPEAAPWGVQSFYFEYTDAAPFTCQECGEDPCMCFDPARLRRGEI